MQLRLRVIGVKTASRTLAGRRLAAVLGLLLSLALSLLAGGARGAAGDHPSPLHLSAAPSSEVAGSYELVATAGPGALAAPTATALSGGSLPTSTSYSYVYSIVDAVVGETGPSPSASATTTSFPARRQIEIGGLPAAGETVRIYRKRSGRFHLLVELVNNTSSTYTDSNATEPPTATILPQAENRITMDVTGFAAFSAGVPVSADSTNDNSPVTAMAPTTPSGKGWIVDGPGNVHFAAGQWAFRVDVQNYGGSVGGAGELRAAMWKVRTSGGAVATSTLIMDGNAAADETAVENISSGSTAKVSVDYRVTAPSFSLGPDEHLYVEFFRYQTTAYSTLSGGESRVATLYASDGVARIEHPAVSTLPDAPTLASPADLTVTAARTLSAFFSDPDAGDSGQVEFRVCTAAAAAGVECSPAVDSGFSPTVANGAPGSWTIAAALSHGAIYWQARGVDALGGASAWTATRSFVVDVPPASPLLSLPRAGAFVRAATPTLRAAYDDPDGDPGRVRFRVCTRPSDAGVRCANGVVAGLSGLVAEGAVAAWRSPLALRDRVYYWQARSEDQFGATSAWSATRRVVVARRLVRITSPARLVCTVGGRLTVELRLARAAEVTARFYTSGRLDLVRRFGARKQGYPTPAFRIPYTLERPAVYWVKWTAERRSERGSAWMRIDLRPLARGVVNPPACRPDA